MLQLGNLLLVLLFLPLHNANMILNDLLLYAQFKVVFLPLLVKIVLHRHQLLWLLAVELAQLIKLVFGLS